MSKELNFQDGNDVLKYQDSNSMLKLYLSEDGYPFDLSRFDSLLLKVGNENGFLLQEPVDLSLVDDPKSGIVKIIFDEDVMNKLIPGDYNIELWGEIDPIIYDSESNDVNISVSDAGLNRSQAIFPSDGNLVITVDENIKSSPFDTINAYPIDDIWQSLQQWETDTVSTLNSNITSGLQAEITQWQGDISEKLKEELLKDIASDEGNIKNELDTILTNSLEDLINKEIANLKASVESDVNTAMINDVANQISIIKPEITSDLHKGLLSELTTTLQNDIASWESSTDNDLNNKLAQAIVDKSNAIQSNLSNELTNYISSQLSTYETNATNTITANITSQVTQNIANEFNTEDSQVRTDLENLVKGTIQNDVQNLLNQMQKNGDIYATKDEFNNFISQINSQVAKLNLSSDFENQISSINSQLQEIPNIQSTLNSLNSSAIQYYGNVPSNYLSAINKDGIYNLAGRQYSDGPYAGLIWGTIIQVGTEAGVQSQIILTNFGTMYFRMINSWGIEGWFLVSKESDVEAFKDEITKSAILRHDDISVANASSLDNLKDNYDSGIYYIRGNYNIAPSNSSAWGIMTMNKYSSGDVFLEYQDIWFNKNYFTTHNASGWEAWSTAVTQTDLSTAINQVNNSVSQLNSSINSTTSNFNSLSNTTTNIVSAVSSNATNIASNSSNINSLSNSTNSAIASNANNINSIVSNASSLSSSVASNAVNIASNANSINSLNNSYSTISSQVSQVSNDLNTAINQVNNSVVNNANSISANTTNISNVQSQVNGINSNTLQFKGDTPSNSLYQITQSGIYNLAGKPYDDFGSAKLYGQLTVVNTGGVVNQTLRNNHDNCWVQTLNSWGNTGWKQIY